MAQPGAEVDKENRAGLAPLEEPLNLQEPGIPCRAKLVERVPHPSSEDFILRRLPG